MLKTFLFNIMLRPFFSRSSNIFALYENALTSVWKFDRRHYIVIDEEEHRF